MSVTVTSSTFLSMSVTVNGVASSLSVASKSSAVKLSASDSLSFKLSSPSSPQASISV